MNPGSSLWRTTVVAITPDDNATAELDNKMFARAAKITPIAVPAEYGTSVTSISSEEIVEAYVNSVLVVAGPVGNSVWHGITNWPQFTYVPFRDLRDLSGTIYQIYVNDLITLKFSDGSTVKVKFIGPYAPSGLMFQWEHGSERDPQGKMYSGANNSSATPLGGTSFEYFFVVTQNTCTIIATVCAFGCNSDQENAPC